jgi:hypothetical protein
MSTTFKRSSLSTVPSLSFLHWSGPNVVVPAGFPRQVPESRALALFFLGDGGRGGDQNGEQGVGQFHKVLPSVFCREDGLGDVAIAR